MSKLSDQIEIITAEMERNERERDSQARRVTEYLTEQDYKDAREAMDRIIALQASIGQSRFVLRLLKEVHEL